MFNSEQSNKRIVAYFAYTKTGPAQSCARNNENIKTWNKWGHRQNN